ncbi:protein TIFY 6a-like [Oryza brachyantha]|uniref:protein TIFY 6a-like n=1 Tax=Oryza brachyantha TaxID=4533 RepID=UPI001ADD251E|nr:protein TIFY 6a-like [Oryza brachyantha]
MERDFLGAIGRREMVKEEAGRPEHPDYLGGGGGAASAAMQWQFPAKVGAASSAFMSFRSAAREEDSKEAVFDRFSLSGFRPPPRRPSPGDASPVIAHQRQFGFDGQVSRQQYAAAAHGHREQGVDSYGVAAAHRHPVPFGQANPMLRVQSLPNVAGGSPYKNQPFTVGSPVAGSTVGVYGGTRDLQNPKSRQMTIFYDGAVNVFDNVPVEKAQELVLLASRASILSPPSVARKSDSPIPATAKLAVPEVLPARQIIVQKPEASVPHVSVVSNPVTIVSQAVTLPKSSSSSNDSAGPKSGGLPLAVTPLSQAAPSQPTQVANTNASAIMPRAVPQARKASLARFLEKRKERVSSVVPYPSSKSPLESSDTMGSPSTPSKSSCMDITPSTNNCEESLCLGQPRNISFSSQEPPSTKLQI